MDGVRLNVFGIKGVLCGHEFVASSCRGDWIMAGCEEIRYLCTIIGQCMPFEFV